MFGLRSARFQLSFPIWRCANSGGMWLEHELEQSFRAECLCILELKGGVNPATISKPEFLIFFTILNMNRAYVSYHYQHK